LPHATKCGTWSPPLPSLHLPPPLPVRSLHLKWILINRRCDCYLFVYLFFVYFFLMAQACPNPRGSGRCRRSLWWCSTATGPRFSTSPSSTPAEEVPSRLVLSFTAFIYYLFIIYHNCFLFLLCQRRVCWAPPMAAAQPSSPASPSPPWPLTLARYYPPPHPPHYAPAHLCRP